MPAQDIATRHYLRPGVMTAPGPGQPLLAGLAEVAHGLLIHEHIAGAYGVTLTDERRASVHVRPVAALLGQIAAGDGRPLTQAREPARRLPGNCRHYTVLAVAMLRAEDPRLHVPDRVYNAVRNRAEPVLPGGGS